MRQEMGQHRPHLSVKDDSPAILHRKKCDLDILIFY